MSWYGGGEISATPGCVWRSRAISGVTLCPGSWPPSPGFEPCAILICSSSAKTAYSGVTPKRPEATCLILQLRSSRKRAGSSPPSPEVPQLDRLAAVDDRGKAVVALAVLDLHGAAQRVRRGHLVECLDHLGIGRV